MPTEDWASIELPSIIRFFQSSAIFGKRQQMMEWVVLVSTILEGVVKLNFRVLTSHFQITIQL